MIIFEKVTIGFEKKTIIGNFSETITKGEHICLMGKSGAGKSSLLTSVIGFNFPDKGNIKVDRQTVNPENISRIRSNVSWVPQELNLPYESVKESIMAPYNLKVNKHLIFNEQIMFELFEKLDLDSKVYKQRMQNISGGERQRLMLISAIMLKRSILLLDEPTSALDNTSSLKLTELLRSLKGITILAVTHDNDFAQKFDRSIIL